MGDHTACFSPYMLISSTLQTVFGFDRRSEQETQAEIAEQHQIELRMERDAFQDELEVQKISDMRAKMAVARKYRSEERFEQTVLQHRTEELKKFFMECLPIKKICIPILIEEAERYRDSGYDASCPLNVILLHTRQSELDYEEICNGLDRTVPLLGNIIYRRWCDKDVAHNAGILNLHAVMGNIPTVAISPYFQNGVIHFTVSMWEAQSDAKPLIRPLFSIKCPQEYLGKGQKFTEEGRKAIQERITLIGTIISGCARDSYMLMAHGLAPTLPLYLKENPDVVRALMLLENKEVCDFMLNEYSAAKSLLGETECASKLLTKEEMLLLAENAESAEKELLRLTERIN